MKQKLSFLYKERAAVRILLVSLGNIILGLGNAICVKTGLGADPLNVLYQGTASFLGVSTGTASLVVSAVMLAVTIFLDIRQIGVGTVLAIFLTSAGINMGMAIVPECPWFPVNYMIMLMGLCTIAFGIALSIYADYGKSSYDALIFGFMHRTKLKYYQIRWGLDILFLVTGILLGGKMTPATVIAVVITGKIVTLFVQILRKTNWIQEEERKTAL